LFLVFFLLSHTQVTNCVYLRTHADWSGRNFLVLCFFPLSSGRRVLLSSYEAQVPKRVGVMLVGSSGLQYAVQGFRTLSSQDFWWFMLIWMCLLSHSLLLSSSACMFLSCLFVYLCCV